MTKRKDGNEFQRESSVFHFFKMFVVVCLPFKFFGRRQYCKADVDAASQMLQLSLVLKLFSIKIELQSRCKFFEEHES